MRWSHAAGDVVELDWSNYNEEPEEVEDEL